MQFRKHLFLIFIILCLSTHTIGQKQEYKFQHLISEQGINQTWVHAIFMDSTGYLWIGTDNGLYRYNGYTFTEFKHNPHDSLSLSGNSIYGIDQDKNGDIWVVTKLKGLNVYSPEKNSFRRITSKNSWLNDDNLRTVLIDSKGEIWIGGVSMGLCRYNPEKKTAQYYTRHKRKRKNGISRNFIWTLNEDSDRNIWIGTNWGGVNVWYRKQDTIIHYMHKDDDPKSLSHNLVRAICHDSEKNIWIGTGKGLSLFEPQTRTFRNYYASNTGKGNVKIFAISEDDNGNLWLGSELKGMFLFDKQTSTWIQYNRTNCKSCLNSISIHTFCNDKKGTLWIGTNGGGVNYINQHLNKFSHYSKNYVVGAITQTASDNIIIAGTRLTVFNPEKNSMQVKIGYEAKLKSNVVLCMDYDKSNKQLWFGTWQGGLSRYDETEASYHHYMPTKTIEAIYKDIHNNLWVSSNEGAYLYDPKNDKIVKKDVAFENVRCKYIRNDSRGFLWIGSENGLYRYNYSSDQMKTYLYKSTDSTSLSNSNVNTIFEDSQNRLWIGTSAGLNQYKYSTDNFIRYYKKDGLSDNNIVSMLEDDNGYLWIGTANGMSKFNPKDKSAINYYKTDGLQANQFKANAALQISTGEMIFGGINGFNFFHPDSIRSNPYPPPVVITGFKIFNKEVPIKSKDDKDAILTRHISRTKKIVLSYKHSVFSFDFAALNYVLPEKNMYAYKMEEFDKDWNYVGTKRSATYTNLDHGKYIFRVKATNNDGLWNTDGVALHIEIVPPWWRTLWFRISAALFIIASIATFFLIRIARIKKQKAELEKLVDERTKEIQEANLVLEERQEEILQQTEEIKQQRDDLEEKHEELEKAYHNMSVVSEFGQRITARFDMEAINQMIYKYVSSLMDTSAFGIGLFNERRGIIEFDHFMEDGQPIPYFYRKVDNQKSLTAYCMRTQKEVFINNLEEEYTKYIREMPIVQTENAPKSLIHLPLLIEDKMIGVLIVNSNNVSAYTVSDLTNLRTLASYIAIALDNANAYYIVERQNENIKGSIRYAKTIQNAMLPSKDEVNRLFDNFILFRPKDIVSGDFYWQTTISDNKMTKLLIGVVDCTGHGVPGAFMSLIGNRLLSEIVNEHKVYQPVNILHDLDNNIKAALRQDETDNDDGMDVCLVSIETIPPEDDVENSSDAPKRYQVIFAGAKRPLIYYTKQTNKVHYHKGSRRSIGGVMKKRQQFEETLLTLQQGDMIYLSSDGFIDQPNPLRKRFSTRRLLKLLDSIAALPAGEQKLKLEQALDKYTGNALQRDDITMLGIRL